MKLADTLHFARHAASGTPLRTSLLILSMAIGVAAVVVLTALGDGARRYVVGEFSSIGTNLVIVLPGRSETRGFSPANLVTSTPRDLTLEDAASLLRVSGVARHAPIVVGTAEVNAAGKQRESMLVGTNGDFLKIRNLNLGMGAPVRRHVGHGPAEVVLGAVIAPNRRQRSPLGKTRVTGWRLRVVAYGRGGGHG